MAKAPRVPRRRAPDTLYDQHKALMGKVERCRRDGDAAGEADARNRAALAIELITAINWQFFKEWKEARDAKMRHRS